MNTFLVTATLNKLPEVTWDRFAGTDENISVFGWIARDDGRSDFALLMMDEDGPWLISTSSAKHSADFSPRLGMDSDGHTGCRRVEDHFPEAKCVRLSRPCPRCGHCGFIEDADMNLAGVCPECHGAGRALILHD